MLFKQMNQIPIFMVSDYSSMHYPLALGMIQAYAQQYKIDQLERFRYHSYDLSNSATSQ